MMSFCGLKSSKIIAISVGPQVGDVEGDAVGDLVGGLVGAYVGASEGDLVGDFVGAYVGASEGDLVGPAVGSAVTATCTSGTSSLQIGTVGCGRRASYYIKYYRIIIKK